MSTHFQSAPLTSRPNRQVRFAILFVLGLGLAGLVYWRRPVTPAVNASPAHEYHFFVFNTPCHLQVWDATAEQANEAFRETSAALQKLHDTINIFASDSELSRLNGLAARQPVACSDTLWELVMAAEEAFRITDGVFDITVGPLMQLWGFHEQMTTLPAQDEIAAARNQVGFDKLVLDRDRHSVFFPVPGMRLDFGGLAKGYALEIAETILKRQGLTVFLLDLGGNILASTETPAPNRKFQVGIRDPRTSDQLAAMLELQGACLATSGNYQRFRVVNGQKVGHLMDPRTGRPGDFCAGVTVRTPKGRHSDVFSTAVFIAGADLAQRLAKHFPRTGFLLLKDAPEQQPLTREIVGDLKL